MQNATNLTNSITLKSVSKKYDTAADVAIRDVTFDVRNGEFVCIIGPSGCGKSTVLKLIAGLDQPSSGTMKKPENVTMVFQSGALLPWLSLSDNVALGLRAKHLDEDTVQKETAAYIDMMELNEVAQKYPREVSGGQKQRVGVARALAVNPDVLLLDEPFSALDAKTTNDLHEDLVRIWMQTKKTIVMVSHSIEEAVFLAQRIILMKDSTVDKLFPVTLPRPRHEEDREFINLVLEIRKEFFVESSR